VSLKQHVPPYTFCPVCGSGLDTTHAYRQPCTNCTFIFYHSSSPCMGAIPLDGSRVLLARRGIEPFLGAWNIVGGFLEYGEEPLAGLMREVHEETGCACRVLDFIIQTADTYGEMGTALLNSYYTVELLSGTLTPMDDGSELCWFELGQLPADLPFVSDRRALEALQRMPGVSVCAD